MGRKIPGKKHRGVKDPFQQIAKRNESLSAKINAPPLQPDNQDIPKSLIRLMKLKEDVRQGKFKPKPNKKKRRKGEQWLIDTEALAEKDRKLPGMTKPDKPVPRLIQKPGESTTHFLHRLDQACHEVIKESQFEDKYRVNVIRDPQTGEVIDVAKRPRDPVFESDKVRKKKGTNNFGADENMSKTAKRKLKKLQRKQLQDNEPEKDFNMFKDTVQFGEVVGQPPQLKPSQKMKARSSEMKPGKRNLLLKSFLDNGEVASKASVKLDLTLKRKKIPAAESRQLELQRVAAVEAYRTAKLQKKNKKSNVVTDR